MALGINMIDLDLVEKYLKCKDFDGLSSFLDEIEESNLSNGSIYFYRTLIDLKISSFNELIDKELEAFTSLNFHKALKYMNEDAVKAYNIIQNHAIAKDYFLKLQFVL